MEDRSAMSEGFVDDSARQGQYAAQVADAERRARGIAINYRLAAVGKTASDVVEHAGGLLCDRALAGWEVTAFVADSPNSRPLQIVGSNTCGLDASLPRRDSPYPHVLVVAASLYDCEPRVRASVLRTLDRGVTQVLFWGMPPSPVPRRRTRQMHYRPSSAARLFKAQALAAAHGAADDMSDVEMFSCLEPRARDLTGDA
jgi:hypothetical protein